MQERHTTGVLSELTAMGAYVARGYEIFTPLAPSSRSDFIAVRGLDVVRVQVKTATFHASGPGGFRYLQARMKTSNPLQTKAKNTYDERDCDVIAFVYRERVWLAPIEEVSGRTSICLDSDNPNYKPKKDYDAASWEVH